MERKGLYWTYICFQQEEWCKKRRLLLTGFDPFGGADINPAWEAVALLPNTIGDFELCKYRIPTAFGEAAWVGFIHVPYLPEQGSPSLSVENSAC